MIRSPVNQLLSGQVTAQVTGPDGIELEGTLTEYSQGFYAWKPSGQFALGEHTVALEQPLTGARSTFTITVVAARDRRPPEVTAAPTIASSTQTSSSACCMTPLKTEIVERCVPVLEETLILINPNFASAEPVATLNQFMFQARLDEDAIEEAGGWRPFDQPSPIRVLEADDSYCVELEAIDIVTGEVHVYSDLARCLPRGDAAIGETELQVPDELLADPSCLQAPPSYEAKWCELNRPRCGGEEESCELYRYACEGAALPSPWREMAAHPAFRYSNIRVDAIDSGDCAVTRVSSSRAESRVAWLAALLLVLVAQRGASRGRARRAS